MKLYIQLENLLIRIEENLSTNVSIEEMAESEHYSVGHLQRLFKASFGITLGDYYRSRRLAASLDTLFNSTESLTDIALLYGFEHSQSYIRAFKKEFKISPGQLRQSKAGVCITPPLQLFPINQVAEGVLFGPAIVYMPAFHCIGLESEISNDTSAESIAQIARNFWFNEKDKVPDLETLNVYIGLTKLSDTSSDLTHYFPSVFVSNRSNIPDGFVKNTIPPGMYAKFHYIGQGNPYLELNSEVAQGMYNAIHQFQQSVDHRYGVYHKTLTNGKPSEGFYFEKISEYDIDEPFYVMEWYSPVYEK